MGKTATKLILIAKKAREEPSLKFTTLIHHLNEEYLWECYQELKRGKAAGIDGRTVESYSEEEIKEAIQETVEKMKGNKYRPKPAKRVYIAKGGNKKKERPLGMPTVIDKMVQQGIKKILERIWEPTFLNCSYGYRPNRDAHEALKATNHMIMQRKINWIVDADIEGFFDRVDHKWMMECLSQRIQDRRFIKSDLKVYEERNNGRGRISENRGRDAARIGDESSTGKHLSALCTRPVV